MRIDKFLKVARVVKKRSIAKVLADNGKIKINGKICKPSTEVDIKDIIELTFGHRQFTIRVTSLLLNPKKNEAETMYEIIEQ